MAGVGVCVQVAVALRGGVGFWCVCACLLCPTFTTYTRLLFGCVLPTILIIFVFCFVSI